MKIDAVNVGVRIDGRQIVADESLSCAPGTMTALVGPSGCGKTTLLHCLGLLHHPDSGQVFVDGTSTGSWKAKHIRRFWARSAAFVIQDYGIVDDESVAYNVAMSAGVFSNRVQADQRRLSAALDRTGLAGRGDDRASHLSGGEKQRLAIARAIYKDAAVIFVDEPTASLDSVNRSLVVELFLDRAEAGCTVIVATHDDEMMRACGTLHAVNTAHSPTTDVMAD
ncbi:ATP-binding cassette domain-containing protein [Amycolatopsis sp. NPDC089917]|uniref:ABC transporter ATP-binding protein n=1 Tax=Amycolatopsis sp. NPDC089917 TaxID=3155187 RepID=UPI00342DF21D